MYSKNRHPLKNTFFWYLWSLSYSYSSFFFLCLLNLNIFLYVRFVFISRTLDCQPLYPVHSLPETCLACSLISFWIFAQITSSYWGFCRWFHLKLFDQWFHSIFWYTFSFDWFLIAFPLIDCFPQYLALSGILHF